MEFAQTLVQTKPQNLLREILIILATSIVFGLCGSISIPLPFTPVPIVFSLQAIILFSVLLGRKGAYATVAYLSQGALGLPVFAGGAGGIAYFFGPTGGYLIGFAILSYVIGVFSERMQEKSPSKVFVLMLFGNALVYVFGLPQLALFVGFKNALSLGLYPFLAADMLKLILAHRILKALKFF